MDVKKSAAVIRKAPGKNKWTVYSEKGRPMGTYDSLSGAKKRLNQIEYFKHNKADDIIEPRYIGEPPKDIKVEIKTSRINSIADFYKISQLCDCKIHDYDGNNETWTYIDEDMDEDDQFELAQNIEQQIDALFKDSGIRMMNRDEYSKICISEDGRVLGCIVSHQDGFYGDDYDAPIVYFSIVTDKKCQGKGIATKLIDSFVRDNERNVIKSETYNRYLDGLLERKGFVQEFEEYIQGDNSIKFHILIPEYLRRIEND